MGDGSSSFFNKKLSVRHQDIMHSLKKKAKDFYGLS